MSLFSTTVKLHHRTPLPPCTQSGAISLVHNHDLLIQLDPELAHYEERTNPSSFGDKTVPEPNRTVQRKTKYYHVTDHMHALPAGLWDSTVSFDAEITDIDDGVEWLIKAPLGLVQRTFWRVVEATNDDKAELGEDTNWCLVEDVEIKCSRLLMGTVKGKCESNWRGIHKKFVEKLQTGEA
ncbi:hypothetical protein M501DRAFT_966307 [Patellaria atrata CBS 101060]|uniref:DUF7053 domain-containing protein n=1 Tax=Patellaria atrata CBS 101060 TaxID=1346257 RepID=A0A9P4SII5_9PEZI|nr:hypothetical protein M501DRAFT_966307 [Patellaria atrata CBS 101060]